LSLISTSTRRPDRASSKRRRSGVGSTISRDACACASRIARGSSCRRAATVDGELLDAGRQRMVANLSTGPLRRVHDLTRRRIENSMVERLETYPIFWPFIAVVSLFRHGGFVPPSTSKKEVVDAGTRPAYDGSFCYSMMLATTPAPTCGHLPDREAQLLFHRDRTIRCTSIAMLSPGITISCPRADARRGHVRGAEVELRR